MQIFNKLLHSRSVKNAVQEQTNGFSNGNVWLNGNVNPTELFFGNLNRAGKYDNFYGNTNRIVTAAARHPLYYTVDDEVMEPSESLFAYYLTNLNDSFPQRKILEQIYTELITHGHSDIFLWHKDGRGESRHFDKLYNEDDFRGLTLVSGYDKNTLTKKDKDSIVRIIYGASQANVFMGYSPSQAADSWRKMQDEMGLHMTAFAKNAGMPLGTFIISSETPEEYVKIKDELAKRTAGAKNNGKVMYSWKPGTASGASPQIQWVQYSSQDVQDYTSQMEFADKKITQDFGVPGTVKGTNDGENYATANVSKQGFVEWTIEPLVSTVKEQIEFQIRKRFDIRGEIRVDVEIPELADESKVKIEATERQVALFDAKIAEGYTAESIIKAYNLPERFLLLEKGTNSSSASNKAKTGLKQPKLSNKAEVRNEYARYYQNALTKAERKRLEDGFSEILNEYAEEIWTNGTSNLSREDFEGKMVAHFGEEYKTLYGKTLEDVAEELADVLEVVDVADLELTDDELELAKAEYNRRVTDFSKSFTDIIDNIDGDTLAVKSRNAQPHIKMVTVTESEHTRIVQELAGWTKAQEEFPVRVYKQWHTRAGACPECISLEDVQIDVTALFIGNETDEIYRVAGGGLHQNCRCWCTYEMEAK